MVKLQNNEMKYSFVFHQLITFWLKSVTLLLV